MSESIERAAQELFDAIWENVGRSWPRWHDGATDKQKREARIAARAAIVSLRVPTAEMLKAGTTAANKVSAVGVGGFIIDEAWRSMIDAAASEQWNDAALAE